MKRAALLLSLTLLATPGAAQDDDGFNLMEEGAKLFLRGLMSEMEPALNELEDAMREMQPLMQNFLSEMGPALQDIMKQVDDWSVYSPPEMLPNGDIVIRRKQPLTPDSSEQGGKDEIEL